MHSISMKEVGETKSTSPATIEHSLSRARKEQRWQRKVEEVKSITDKLGPAIDSGVTETVAALNLLGVNTVGSCEGHMQNSTGAPYIDVGGKKSTSLLERFIEMYYKEGITQKTNNLKTQIEQINLPEQTKIMDLLESFYEGREVSYGKRLTIRELGFGASRIESEGAILQKIVTPELKQQRLAEYQAEMRTFTIFLKDRYLSV